MIYTSYYSKKISIDCKKIQISNTKPSGYRVDYTAEHFYPSDIAWRYKSGLIDENQYIEEYRNKLSKINDRLFDIIMNKYLSDTIYIMLCYESPEKFCHRHILTDWLNEKFNININEFEQ